MWTAISGQSPNAHTNDCSHHPVWATTKAGSTGTSGHCRSRLSNAGSKTWATTGAGTSSTGGAAQQPSKRYSGSCATGDSTAVGSTATSAHSASRAYNATSTHNASTT